MSRACQRMGKATPGQARSSTTLPITPANSCGRPRRSLGPIGQTLEPPHLPLVTECHSAQIRKVCWVGARQRRADS